MAFVSRAQFALTVLGCTIGAVAIARHESAQYALERARAAQAAPAAHSAVVRSAPAGPVDLNGASLEQLTALPGVGPKLAARILARRAQNGPFRSLADLDAVEGVGAKMLAKLAPHVRW